MSKVTMPEPVVYRSKDTPYLFSLDGPETDGFEGLITITQAEAYADARVREALQVVAGTVEQYHPKATQKGIAAAIRLIASTDGLTAPPLPGPVEPTT